MNLHYTVNPFQGAHIKTPESTIQKDSFTKALEAALNAMKQEGLVLAWLNLPHDRSHLINSAVGHGFIYHHADHTGLELYCRLVPDAFVPGYSTHYIGAGGVVLDKENRILIIQERYHTKRHYKLPGGALDPAEHISNGVIREVEEETGIKTRFRSLNCFRHWHGYRYGKSDIYFVCRLDPLTTEITIDEKEIAMAVWIPIDKYLNHPDTHPFNRKIVSTTISTEGLKIEEISGYGSPETHEMMFYSKT